VPQTLNTQQGDVTLFQTPDDGDISVDNGLVVMSGGLETAAYLALFGGNDRDSGGDDDPRTWWGNTQENNPSRQYRSETQFLLNTAPAIPANLKRVEDAALRDLSFFLEDNIASSVEVVASMPGLNKINLTVDIIAFGEESRFEYVENWKATL